MSALQNAAEWRLMSLLLERPRGGWHQEVQTLSKELVDPLLLIAAASASAATEEAYLSLLGPGGVFSAREAGYIGMEDPGQMLADVSAFYRAFMYQPDCEDPPDHIAVETGFLGFLALKEAYAETSENPEAAEITRSAAQRFMESHLARLAYGLTQKFQGDVPEYLTETLGCLLKRCTAVCPPASGSTGEPPELQETECTNCFLS